MVSGLLVSPGWARLMSKVAAVASTGLATKGAGITQ